MIWRSALRLPSQSGLLQNLAEEESHKPLHPKLLPHRAATRHHTRLRESLVEPLPVPPPAGCHIHNSLDQTVTNRE
jgi:hypothetical protein